MEDSFLRGAKAPVMLVDGAVQTLATILIGATAAGMLMHMLGIISELTKAQNFSRNIFHPNNQTILTTLLHPP